MCAGQARGVTHVQRKWGGQTAGAEAGHDYYRSLRGYVHKWGGDAWGEVALLAVVGNEQTPLLPRETTTAVSAAVASAEGADGREEHDDLGLAGGAGVVLGTDCAHDTNGLDDASTHLTQTPARVVAYGAVCAVQQTTGAALDHHDWRACDWTQCGS